MTNYESWGNFPVAQARTAVRPVTKKALLTVFRGSKPLLPIGNSRSQGDSCLNEDGTLLDMRGLNHFLAFDAERGILRCEAGVTLADILTLIVPHGWFLTVTPGTKYITVGGAIANDVHGKNHERVGTFGNVVEKFELVRSTGETLICSRQENHELWQATIGGLGLTGAIIWAEIKLRPISTQFIAEKIIPLRSIDDFFHVATSEFEYSVAWLDCLARGRRLGQGHLLLGNHVEADTSPHGQSLDVRLMRPRFTIPVDAPNWLINRSSVAIFNTLWRQRRQRTHEVHFNPFFYPLDGVEQWNRLYGKRGFFQYQCVVPRVGGHEVVRELLARIAHSGLASFLSTLKLMGDVRSEGILSFSRPGISFAVDFANAGQPTLDLFNRLDEIVQQAGGALYPAKDSRMSPAMFRHSFPRWQEFTQYIDPALSSSFWRRIMA